MVRGSLQLKCSREILFLFILLSWKGQVFLPTFHGGHIVPDFLLSLETFRDLIFVQEFLYQLYIHSLQGLECGPLQARGNCYILYVVVISWVSRFKEIGQCSLHRHISIDNYLYHSRILYYHKAFPYFLEMLSVLHNKSFLVFLKIRCCLGMLGNIVYYIAIIKSGKEKIKSGKDIMNYVITFIDLQIKKPYSWFIWIWLDLQNYYVGDQNMPL